MRLNSRDRECFVAWCQAKAKEFDLLAESDAANKPIHYANALAMMVVMEQLTKEEHDEEASQAEDHRL